MIFEIQARSYIIKIAIHMQLSEQLNESKIVNIEKIHDFLTILFMFRYHYLDNLPKYFTNYYVTITTKYMSTIQETHPNFINHTQLILSNIHFTLKM
jgi:hypothetical protein